MTKLCFPRTVFLHLRLPQLLDGGGVTFWDVGLGADVERVLHVHHLLPPAAGFVVVAEESLLPADGLRGLHGNQPVAPLRVLTHQDPAFLQILTRTMLLQLLLGMEKETVLLS